MGRVKGCINEECVAYKKKIKYKNTEDFCSKCGNRLSYVCKNKNCQTPLEDEGKEKYCVRHLAERKDKSDNAKKVVGVAGGGILTLGAVVATKGKDVVKIISKIK